VWRVFKHARYGRHYIMHGRRQATMHAKDGSKAGNSRQWVCVRRHYAVGRWRGRGRLVAWKCLVAWMLVHTNRVKAYHMVWLGAPINHEVASLRRRVCVSGVLVRVGERVCDDPATLHPSGRCVARQGLTHTHTHIYIYMGGCRQIETHTCCWKKCGTFSPVIGIEAPGHGTATR
jgi:hypothetical protein